jgi:hypothetical protein
MEYTDAVEIISELFGIGSWEVGEYGERAAIIDQHIEIRISRMADNIMLVRGIFGDAIPNASVANANEVGLRYLLQANCIRIIRDNDVLFLDKQTGRLATIRQIPLADASLGNIVDSVESFVRNVDFWDIALQRKQSSSIISPRFGFSRKK